jgi:dGTPase
MIVPRHDLEAREGRELAAYAARSADSVGRLHAEPSSRYRTAFQKDRDRVVHTSAFRRLEYKTQVFVNGEGDHYRTRLTHTLEVAQVSKALARALGLNEDLAETLALAHDLGHPPFGHAGERTLNRLAEPIGGFEHNRQSLRVVTLLERRYEAFAGLNLTFETLRGLMKHGAASEMVGLGPDEAPIRWPHASVEARVVNLADELTYNAHDLDDGLRSGLIAYDDLAGLSMIQLAVEDRPLPGDPELRRHEVVREILGACIEDVIHAASERLESAGSVIGLDEDQIDVLVQPSEAYAHAGRELKVFLHEALYRHPRQVQTSRAAGDIIERLFEAFTSEPSWLPERWQDAAEAGGLVRAVTDYVAGFTDRFAIEEHRRLFDPLGVMNARQSS